MWAPAASTWKFKSRKQFFFFSFISFCPLSDKTALLSRTDILFSSQYSSPYVFCLALLLSCFSRTYIKIEANALNSFLSPSANTRYSLQHAQCTLYGISVCLYTVYSSSLLELYGKVWCFSVHEINKFIIRHILSFVTKRFVQFCNNYCRILYPFKTNSK